MRLGGRDIGSKVKEDDLAWKVAAFIREDGPGPAERAKVSPGRMAERISVPYIPVAPTMGQRPCSAFY